MGRLRLIFVMVLFPVVLFSAFLPGWFGVGVSSFRGRSVAWCWVGVLVLIHAGEFWTPTPTRSGDEPTESANPWKRVF